MNDVAHWLIRRAARGAPGELSERLEEEWSADLGARRSAWSRVSFAIGCIWATMVIAREHGLSEVALVRHTAGARFAIPYPHDSGVLSRRSATLVLVAGLHIAILYALIVGLNPHLRSLVPPPLETRILPHPHQDLPPLPIPPPTPTHTVIDEVIPEFPPIDTGADKDLPAVRETPRDGPQLPPQTAQHVASRVQGGPGSGFPNTDDYYPSAAKFLQEQGVATVRVCVDANGRLTSDPVTVQGSGSARLDAGALQLAKAGSGHYRATTEDGRPVSACYPFRVRFQLRN